MALRAVSGGRLGILAVSLVAFWVVLGVYVVHVNLPRTALDLPGAVHVKPVLRSLMPEGWAFFTRNPREPDLVAFVLEPSGRWSSGLLAPHAEPRNFFGLDRRSRAQGVEMGLLQGSVPGALWRPCREEPGACLQATASVAVRNASPQPTLCGSVGLARVEPLPWAWARAPGNVVMPSNVIRLTVAC